LVRQADRAPRIADQQLERAAADGLKKGLGPQVCRPDRIGLADDVRATILVARDRQRQTESEKLPDKAEEHGKEQQAELQVGASMRSTRCADCHTIAALGPIATDLPPHAKLAPGCRPACPANV
jgi:hypothetical protein